MKALNVLLALAIGCSGLAWAGPYQANKDSLLKHEDAPEWFRDAKLGIYFHWGVYAVPAFGSEWYPRNMFLKGNAVNKHHIETYGDPAEYGYDRFVDQWKTPKFHARQWARLFRETGARFAGPVAEHHDGFSLWDSDVTPWNAVDKGPKRDLVGELAEAIRAEGMKYITTFHHARNHYGHFDGMKKDYPQAMADPEVAFLYAQMSPEKFHDVWLNKLKEVIDQYQPDIIWFDSWLDKIPESYRYAFCAYYLNAAAKRDKEVVIIRKQTDLPIEFSVNDHEKSRESKAAPRIWMTDDTISTGSWCYTRNLRIKPASKVIHALVDTVAKNGVVLLNISPMADGTIPEDQQKVLRELGRWMKLNGEAIYATRPWKTFGEGPTVEPAGGFRDHGKFLKLEYSAKDIRYTQSKDGKTVYAVICGWPGAEVVLSAVKVKRAGPRAMVKLIGYARALKHSTNEEGRLVIHLPDLSEAQRPGQHAYSFKLSGFALEAATPARFVEPITLPAEKALLDGSELALENKLASRANVGFWNSADERVHWLVKIPSAGAYKVQGEFATTSGQNSLVIEVAGKRVSFTLPNTGSWDKPRTVKAGTISFAKRGVYHLVLSPKASNWRAANLWNLQLIPAE